MEWEERGEEKMSGQGKVREVVWVSWEEEMAGEMVWLKALQLERATHANNTKGGTCTMALRSGQNAEVRFTVEY